MELHYFFILTFLATITNGASSNTTTTTTNDDVIITIMKRLDDLETKMVSLVTEARKSCQPEVTTTRTASDTVEAAPEQPDFSDCDPDALLFPHSNFQDACKSNATAPVCSGRGHCNCGSCVCNDRDNPEEAVNGQFCECDNFSCDRINGKICNGHGKCECGRCVCEPEWDNPMFPYCTCLTSEEGYLLPGGGQVCSGNGVCHCGKCNCDWTTTGQFCEISLEMEKILDYY